MAITALCLIGCYDPVTEVLLVVPSDLTLDISSFATVLVTPGNGLPKPADGFGSPLLRLPLTASVVTAGSTASFSAEVIMGSSPFQGDRVLITRTVFGVRFEDHQTRMLILPLVSACGCHNDVCPIPGPRCEDLTNPPLVPFDPALANDNAALLAVGVGAARDASAAD